MTKELRKILKKKLIGKTLTDAHRHSLYDMYKIIGMEGLSVENWSSYSKFIAYQKKTKKLYGKELYNEIKEWLEFSKKESIGTILDFSAKHATNDLKNIYYKYNIKSFFVLKWNKTDQINKNNIPDFIILPDERFLSLNIR